MLFVKSMNVKHCFLDAHVENAMELTVSSVLPHPVSNTPTQGQSCSVTWMSKYIGTNDVMKGWQKLRKHLVISLTELCMLWVSIYSCQRAGRLSVMHRIDATSVPSLKLGQMSWQPFSLLKLTFAHQLHFPLTLLQRIKGIVSSFLYHKIWFIYY